MLDHWIEDPQQVDYFKQLVDKIADSSITQSEVFKFFNMMEDLATKIMENNFNV